MRAILLLAFAAATLLGPALGLVFGPVFGPVFAQAPTPQTLTPELRGMVVELGTNAPVGGTELILTHVQGDTEQGDKEQEIRTQVTGPDGVFSFKNCPPGPFTLSAKRDGYRSGSADIAGEITTEAAVQTVKLALVRPGTLKGRVISPDGNPVAHLHVVAQAVSGPFGSTNDTQTSPDGTFVIDNLTPGRYLVHPVPAFPDRQGLTPFSEAAFREVDHAAAVIYWPGGAALPDRALPIEVAAGGIANLGDVTAGQATYYRVHVSLTGECSPDERWTVHVQDASSAYLVPDHLDVCRKEFLLTGVAPGDHRMAVRVGTGTAWGTVPFTIKDENIQTTLTLQPPGEIHGQVTVAGGRDLVTLGGAQIVLTTWPLIPPGAVTVFPDKNGAFTLANVMGPTHLLKIATQRDTFVKEIRYNGQALQTRNLTYVPGARLEITLDTGAAKVKGTIPEGTQLLLVREGVEPEIAGPGPPFVFFEASEGVERDFSLRVPPGDYRLLTLNGAAFPSAQDLAARLTTADRIMVGAGETKIVDVKAPVAAR